MMFGRFNGISGEQWCAQDHACTHIFICINKKQMKTVFATDLCGFMDFSAFNIKQSPPMFTASAYNECVYFDTTVWESFLFACIVFCMF